MESVESVRRLTDKVKRQKESLQQAAKEFGRSVAKVEEVVVVVMEPAVDAAEVEVQAAAATAVVMVAT